MLKSYVAGETKRKENEKKILINLLISPVSMFQEGQKYSQVAGKQIQTAFNSSVTMPMPYLLVLSSSSESMKLLDSSSLLIMVEELS